MYKKGYNGSGVKEITDAAGIPKGSFYNYFDSKEDYAVKALDYFYGLMETSVLAPFDDESIPPLQRVRKFFEAERNAMDGSSLMLGCFIGNLTQELGAYDSPVRVKVNELLNAIDDKIQACFEEDKAHVKGDHVLLASFLLDAMHGAFIRTKATASIEPMDRLLKIFDMMVD